MRCLRAINNLKVQKIVPLITFLGIRLLISFLFHLVLFLRVKVVKTDGSGLTAARRCFCLTRSVLRRGITFQVFGIKGREGNHVSPKLDCSGIFYLCKHCSRNRITGAEIPDSKGYLAEITANYRFGKG